jgi:pimeloyl-ACP methyl ester carboxylesterase
MPADGTRTLTLPDGRTLAWLELGEPAGRPAFYFHGYPGSRLEPLVGAEQVKSSGVRLIAIDRPGFGRSSFQPGRRILDWPDDVVALADHLGLARFACLGVSGGGPYALACGWRIPERLTRVAVVCGVAPFEVPEATQGMMLSNRLLFRASRLSAGVARLLVLPMLLALRVNPTRAAQMLNKRLPPPDRAVLGRPEVRDAFIRTALEAFRQGTKAAGQESRLYARPWGFRHEEVPAEIDLYQGERDVNVPPSMGRWQARALPHCNAHFYPDEAHISLVLNHLDEILGRLVA